MEYGGGGSHGLINSQGEFLIPPVFQYISPFDTITGKAFYNFDMVKKGYINSDGSFLFGSKYTESLYLGFNLYAVKVDGLWGVVTEDNTSILPVNYDKVFLNGGILEGTVKDKLELFGLNGTKI